MSDRLPNYFAHFGLTPKFDINVTDLRTAFITKSKEFHPDYHSQSAEEIQDQMLELSTLNNTAFKTLSDQRTRIKHILELFNCMPGEGEAKVPNDFLLQMMEINEEIMELGFEEERASKKQMFLQQVTSIMDQEANDVLTWMTAWDNGDKSDKPLQEVLSYYLKDKYLQRIKDQLSDM